MKNVLEEAKKIFRNHSKDSGDLPINLDLEIHKKLLSIFQVGDFYYYVFNLKKMDHDFVSPEIESVLGYKPDTWTLAAFMSCVHPDDVPWFLNFEHRVATFFAGLKENQILKYKVRYDFRIKKNNGDYMRVLQQMVAIQHEGMNVLRTFGVHTDITHLKKEGKPVLSLIGLDGEPSYIDIDVDKVFTPSESTISEREKQVLHLLIEGKPSKVIADELSISAETVNKHRKNMLRKTNTASTAELVGMAVKRGWL